MKKRQEKGPAMIHEMIDGTYRQTNLPNESLEYLAKREELRLAEIELRNTREKGRRAAAGTAKGCDEFRITSFLKAQRPSTMAMRRQKTYGLSELFAPSPNPLPGEREKKRRIVRFVIYHFMYGKKQAVPCPMCTAWIDSFNGVAHHLAQNVDLAIVAAADPSTLRAHARKKRLGTNCVC